MTQDGQGATARTARDLLSPDLLNGLEGIEQGLRRRRSLGRAGGIGLVALATIQIGLAVSSAVTSVSWDAVIGQWYVFVASTVVAATLVLFVALRYWIKESRTAFRYTCRIVAFDAVAPAPANALPTLRHDLAELLNDRIGRLSFLNEEPEGPEQQEAHVHIAGEYLVRREGEGEDRLMLEVTPRLRVGGPSAGETLAHRVSYPLPERKEGEAADELGLERDDIGNILELVYFSIATCLYKQIQRDVERKISLLPTRYLRATAYLYEAEDYAQSNTLDAYDDAQELFEKARYLYDPTARPLPTARFRRLGVRLRRPARWLLDVIRRTLSHLIPRLAKREAMLARTELGLANTLVARRGLARLSGRRINQIFAARAIAERARARLKRLVRIGYPGADETLFDARVTRALVLHYLGSDEGADSDLKCARAALPDRAEENARYLFAAALVEPRTTSALSLLRRAVELSPRFEVAQFERARRTETLWQFRPALERTVAKTVLAEFGNVVRINPGNIQAWSSLGHTRWLLADEGDERALKDVKHVFERGVGYRGIKRETFVAGLHHSLARVTAELGEFAEAYGHYVASTTASVGEGIAHGSWADQRNSVVRNEAILGRFARYVANVDRQREEAERTKSVEPRILRSVQAFVENDYGEACMNFFERTGKEEYLEQAFLQFEKAREANPAYVIPAYNLCLLNRLIGELGAAHENIQAVLGQERKWPEALLEEMMVEAWLSHAPADRWARLEGRIDRLKKKLKADEASLKAVKKNYLTGNRREDSPRLLRSGLGADATEIVAAGSPLDELEARIIARQEKLKGLEKKRAKIESDLRETARQTVKTVHRLVPHEWLWTGSEEQGWEFRWKKVPKARAGGRRRRSDERWVQDFGDLHARALEAWAHTRALSRVDETEGGTLSRGSRRTDQLLRYLEACFWPDREEGLAARLLLGADPSVEERLGSLAARSLAFDPTNYRLLLTADTYLPIEGGGAKKKQKAFKEALRARDVEPPLLAWLAPKLEQLKLYDDAREAYGAAAKGGVDKATVLLGEARAQWGAGACDEAVATLALVPRENGTAAWRTAFVKELVDRGQIQNGAEAAPRASASGNPRPYGRRLVTLTAIHALRRPRRERAPDVPENGVPPLLDAEAQESDACQALVTWLEVEHAACISSGDVAGAEDAAQALLLLTSVRRAEMAPNRTTALPDVTASKGDAELDSESSIVPLIRRLAVEAHPSVFSPHEHRLRELFGVFSDREDPLRALVQEQIPEIQKTIQAKTGVPVPFPSISTSSRLPAGQFRVLANEIEVARGSIGDDLSYEPIVTAIREAIEKHLWTLGGLDGLVIALRATTAENGVVANVLDDDKATLQLLLTVQRLTDEGIDVDLEELLGELAHGDADIDSIVDAIRARRLDIKVAQAEEAAKAILEGPSWAVRR